MSNTVTTIRAIRPGLVWRFCRTYLTVHAWMESFGLFRFWRFWEISFYEPERLFMHLTACSWFLISTGWGGWGKVGSGRGRSEGAELEGENKRGDGWGGCVGSAVRKLFCPVTTLPTRGGLPPWYLCNSYAETSIFFFFVYFFGGLECVGHSFAYVAHLWFIVYT
jgi:hypothetical protein